MKEALLADLLAARTAGIPAALITDLSTGEQGLILPEGIRGTLTLDAEVSAKVRDAISADRSASIETPAGRMFIHVFNPPARLIIIGAVHIAEPLARMGVMAGYAVSVVDPRRAFASRGRFEGLEVIAE